MNEQVKELLACPVADCMACRTLERVVAIVERAATERVLREGEALVEEMIDRNEAHVAGAITLIGRMVKRLEGT